MKRSITSFGRLALTATGTLVFAALFAVTPLGVDLHYGLSVQQALAGNGHGNGGNGGNGGNAGGNGAGNGGGQGNGGVNGHHGNPNAQANSNNPGNNASGLGALNAANASASAFTNASDNSRVGKIRAYRDALNTFLGCNSSCSADLTTAADALAVASNKTLTTGTLNELNSLLGLDTSTDANWGADSQSIVDQANVAQ